MSDLLTVDQVAAKLGCSKSQVWAMRQRDLLPPVVHPTPGKTRWKLADIDRYIELDYDIDKFNLDKE